MNSSMHDRMNVWFHALMIKWKPIMIVSFLSQKGGVGKSTLSRGVAVEYVKSKWDVHVADMDTVQQSTVHWAERRDSVGVEPSIDAAMYRNPQSALKSINRCDLLIVDGTPFATTATKDIAKESGVIVIPTGVTMDDLEPSLILAQDLSIKAKIPKSKMFFVVMKVPPSGDREAMETKSSIKEWGFEVSETWMPMKTGYGKAMDMGYSMAETRFPTLNEKAGKIISDIVRKINQEMNNG